MIMEGFSISAEMSGGLPLPSFQQSGCTPTYAGLAGPVAGLAFAVKRKADRLNCPVRIVRCFLYVIDLP